MNAPVEELPLKDIHLPDPIAWWPPAPGWWILAGLVLLLALAGFWLFRRRGKGRLRRSALKELARIEHAQRDRPDGRGLATELSVLLRRVAISVEPRSEVASLAGEAWLAWLDQGVAQTPYAGCFTRGAGRALVEAPYNPKAEVDADKLVRLARVWIDRSAKAAPLRVSGARTGR